MKMVVGLRWSHAQITMELKQYQKAAADKEGAHASFLAKMYKNEESQKRNLRDSERNLRDLECKLRESEHKLKEYELGAALLQDKLDEVLHEVLALEKRHNEQQDVLVAQIGFLVEEWSQAKRHNSPSPALKKLELEDMSAKNDETTAQKIDKTFDLESALTAAVGFFRFSLVLLLGVPRRPGHALRQPVGSALLLGHAAHLACSET